MRRALCLLCVCALCCSLASAVEVDGAADTAPADTAVAAVPQPFQVEVTLIDGDPPLEVAPSSAPSAPAVEEDAIQAVIDKLDQIDASAEGASGSASFNAGGCVAVLDPAPADRPGLAGVMSEIFGDYTPRTYTTSAYIDGEVVEGSEIVPGLAGLDWYWLGGVALFGLMLFCLFKLLGGIWK